MNSRLSLVARIASGINSVLGAMVMIFPLVSDYALNHDFGVWAALVAGGVLMTFGMMRLFCPEELPVLSWINLALGAFLVVSPWLLRFASDQDLMWSDVALGSVVVMLAYLSARMTLLMRQRLARG